MVRRQFHGTISSGAEPYKREMAHWKNDCRKIMMDQNVNTQGCFKVMDRVEDLHNHQENVCKKDYLPPITEKKGIYWRHNTTY